MAENVFTLLPLVYFYPLILFFPLPPAPKMRSPICHLENQIAGAPFTSAPEKESQCVEHRDMFQFTFALVNEPQFGIRVRLDHDNCPEIVLPIAALEYLWAFSHYCWVLTQEYALAQRAGICHFDCIGSNRLKESFSLLQWAKSNLLGSGIEPWPQAAPRPRPSPQSHGDDEHVASELFLCSLAWMLHHERAHIVLGHPFINTTFSEIEERDADKFATDWLLDGLKANDPRLRKRALGLAVAVLCLQSLEIESNTCLRNTHPAAFDRIDKNTSSYVCGNEEVIEATCTVVLQYLFHDTAVKANVDGNTFSEILGDLLYDIKRAQSN